jgi:hypothetical protein
MKPSDRSKQPPKMTIGPLPAPPPGSKPIQPAAPKPAPNPGRAPAVGSGILSGTGLNFGPAYVPTRRQQAPQGQPVLVTVPRPNVPRQPPPHQPLPMKGVLEDYAKGARAPDRWPDEVPGTRTPPPRPAPRPTPPPAAAKPAVAPEPPPPPAAVEDPGPAPAWMAAPTGRAKDAGRKPLYAGAAALLAVAAFAAVTLLKHRDTTPPAESQPVAAATIADATPQPVLRPELDTSNLVTQPFVPAVPPEKPVVSTRKAAPVKVASATPRPAPAPAAEAPPPVQVAPQPLAVPPPAPTPQPAPRIFIPHIDPSAPIETRSRIDE